MDPCVTDASRNKDVQVWNSANINYSKNQNTINGQDYARNVLAYLYQVLYDMKPVQVRFHISLYQSKIFRQVRIVFSSLQLDELVL